MQDAGIESVRIRSVLTCEWKRGVCIRCYGRNLATRPARRAGRGGRRHRGAVDRRAGHAADDADLPHRRHGGRIEEQSSIEAGTRARSATTTIGRSTEGRKPVAINRNGVLTIEDRTAASASATRSSTARARGGGRREVEDGTKLAEWDPYTYAILTDVPGTVKFQDIETGGTMQEEVDESHRLRPQVIVQSQDEKKHPQLVVDPKGSAPKRKILMPVARILMVRDGGARRATSSRRSRAPRRRPRTSRAVCRASSICSRRGTRRTRPSWRRSTARCTTARSSRDAEDRHPDDDGEEREYSIPKGLHVNVQEGERVRAGDAHRRPEGPAQDPRDLGRARAAEVPARRDPGGLPLQGVNINDKHIETIIRQMMRWIKVEDVGDTEFIVDEQVDRFRFVEENERVLAAGRPRPRRGRCSWASPRRRCRPIRSSRRRASRRRRAF